MYVGFKLQHSPAPPFCLVIILKLIMSHIYRQVLVVLPALVTTKFTIRAQCSVSQGLISIHNKIRVREWTAN